jgi:hypothetical protein
MVEDLVDLVSCRAVIERLTEHQEGEGTPLARSGIRLHLALCKECCLYLRQLRGVQAALGACAATAAVVSPETKARLLDRFRAWHATLPRAGS